MEALADRVELDGLIGIANKRDILAGAKARLQGLTTQGFQEVPSAASTPANGSSAVSEDPGNGIVNRSPVTNYHLYQQPAPTPPATVVTPPAPTQPSTAKPIWPWLVGIPLALGAGAAAGYFWPKQQPAQPTLTPGTSKIGISVTPGA